MKYFGGIEAGGTKMICAIGNIQGKIIKKVIFPTISPKITWPKVIDFFKKENKKTKLSSIGVGCFGPLDLNKDSKNYGEITTTPKVKWNHFNIVKSLKNHFSIPIGFDTDVNAAALAEGWWGAAEGLDTFIYITIGTGIGVGAVVSNKLLHGLIHPEMGHILIEKRKDDNFKSICPYHQNCLEGLASGPSMMKRWKTNKATDLKDTHIAWDLESYYLSIAISNWILCLSPQKVIIGGGLSSKKILIKKIRKNVKDMLNGYVKHKLILSNISKYIVLPKLKNNSGILGAIALGEKLLTKK